MKRAPGGIGKVAKQFCLKFTRIPLIIFVILLNSSNLNKLQKNYASGIWNWPQENIHIRPKPQMYRNLIYSYVPSPSWRGWMLEQLMHVLNLKGTFLPILVHMFSRSVLTVTYIIIWLLVQWCSFNGNCHHSSFWIIQLHVE